MTKKTLNLGYTCVSTKSLGKIKRLLDSLSLNERSAKWRNLLKMENSGYSARIGID